MRGTRTLFAALLVSLAATIFFAARWRDAERRAARAERISLQPPYQRVLLDELEVAQLKKLGLDDPVTALKADLSTQGKLIPFQGVLGGRMAFYDREGMVLLPGGYAYAPGEDGHYLVHAILRYQVAPGPKITWKLLDAHKD